MSGERGMTTVSAPHLSRFHCERRTIPTRIGRNDGGIADQKLRTGRGTKNLELVRVDDLQRRVEEVDDSKTEVRRRVPPWVEGRLLLGRVQPGCCSGTADGSIAGQPDGDSRFVGQAVPEKGALGGSPEEVVVDLAGHVALQAAHDLGLGLAFFEASFDVDLGGLVVAEPAEDDAP